MQGKLRKQKPMPLWRVPLAASTATETNRAAERADIIKTAAHAAQHGTLPCEFWLRTRMTTWPHCMSAARVDARRAATVWPLTAASAAWQPRQITRKNELQQANMPASKQQFEDAKAFLQKADLQD